MRRVCHVRDERRGYLEAGSLLDDGLLRSRRHAVLGDRGGGGGGGVRHFGGGGLVGFP